MNLDTMLERYDGRLLDLRDLSTYERWALPFFHNRSLVRDPHITTTVQIDITAGRANYETSYARHKGASFTAFLAHCMLRALDRSPCFQYRKIGEDWYHFANLPLYFPLAVGGDMRFQDVLLENVVQATWSDFCQSYSHTIERLRRLNYRAAVDENVWPIANFIGNLPYMSFTALSRSRSEVESGRPCFYFGKRCTEGLVLKVPLAIDIDHANADPFVLDVLLKNYIEILGN